MLVGLQASCPIPSRYQKYRNGLDKYRLPPGKLVIMSEKRKPDIVIVAKKQGKKRYRVELYPVRLWPDMVRRGKTGYRVRINGKWVHGDHGFTLTQVTNQLRGFLGPNHGRKQQNRMDGSHV